MPYDTTISRSLKVRVLGSIALMLFLLNLLFFIDHWQTSAEEDNVFILPTEIQVEPTARPSEEAITQPCDELRLRAAQSPETDAALRRRLGLQNVEATQVPVMQ